MLKINNLSRQNLLASPPHSESNGRPFDGGYKLLYLFHMYVLE